MTLTRLLRASLSHYRKLHLSVLAGVALTSAILSGAFVVGDSVKESLRRNAEARLSHIGPVFLGGDRLFTAALGDRVQDALGSDAVVAPILQMEGTATNREGGQRLNRVQIVGMDERFWGLSLSGEVPDGFENEQFAAINAPLAERLGVKEGDTLIMRIELPAVLSKDAPLSGESEQTVPFTIQVSRILGTGDLGHYSLKPEQVPPATLFLPRDRLAVIAEQAGKANALLSIQEVRAEVFSSAVEASWQLEDVQLAVAAMEGGVSQMTGSRVFLDKAVLSALAEVSTEIAPSLTYLATDITTDPGKIMTPYSMVTGIPAAMNSIVTEDLHEDEILLSDWLAEDLGAKEGDSVTLTYNVVGTGRALIEKKRTFQVAGIRPLEKNGWDRSWTPDFPGIFDVDNLADWEPGIPIDRARIRQKDDDYWDDHRTTPKAVVSLAAAQAMWSNRFGEATAVRFRAKDADVDLADALRAHLKLSDVGMMTRDLQSEAAAAVANSLDFGELFASMSFFLIVAALILAALVFVFGIEQRASEIGLLLALGFSRQRVRRLFLAEAAVLALVGAALGLLGGYVYTRLALQGMSSVWREAAAGMEFVYFVAPSSLVSAFVITVIVAFVVVWVASRRVSAISPSALISGTVDDEKTKKSRGWLGVVALCGSLGGLLGCLFSPRVAGSMEEQGLFFGAGFFAAAFGVSLASWWMRRSLRAGRSGSLPSLAALGRRYTLRRRGRSLAVIGLMAAGVFMVTAMNSFRLEGTRGAEKRDAGTGGFAYVGESTLPIYEDLDSAAGREKYGLDGEKVPFSTLSLRVSDGDDASCLNLNRAQSPRLMGVDTAKIAGINPFHFASTMPREEENESPWTLLGGDSEVEEGVTIVPGIVDQSTATYALGKALGDVVLYETVSGESFGVRIVGLLDTSLLQGSVIIDEANFIHFFPDAGGYRYFLLDGKREGAEGTEGAGESMVETLKPVAESFTRMFGDIGMEMRPAAARLDEFNAVQNTYLSIFSTLGGLGLLLGTLGLAIVVSRNVSERRGQLGVMLAVGFSRRDLVKMVIAEHWFLHLTGVIVGLVAAGIAVIPKLSGAAASLPWGLLITINALVLAGGLVFCALAARAVLRGNLIDSIRQE